MGGALCVADEALAAELRDDRTAVGSTPGSLEALCSHRVSHVPALMCVPVGMGVMRALLQVWLLMRSLRTLHLRVQRQCDTALQLASWLHGAVEGSPGCEAHPLSGLVHAVHYPGLPSSASHEVAARQMVGGFGGCFALELSTENAARELPGSLSLFRNATSLGGVESLVEWRRKYDDQISPLLLRMSVGLEEPEQLQADLQRSILAVS